MTATLNFPPVGGGGGTIPSGWQAFPLGDGGYILGLDLSASGAAGGAVCKTDVSGAYHWHDDAWHQVCTVSALAATGATAPPIANGVYDIRGAPSDFSKLYMVYGDVNRVSGAYCVWVSSNAGVTWTKTDLTFSSAGIYWTIFGNDITNGTGYRLTNQKIVVDPVNPNVAYVGIPFGCALTGTYSASTASCFRTLDGGATWAAVSGLPVAANYPGWAGMCIDKSSSTGSLSGQPVKNRIILPCNGVGVYESTNGGTSFTKVSSDATPSTTLSYTTTQTNSIIVVQVLCYGIGQVAGVTNTGTASLTWTKRAGPTANATFQMFLYEYYAVAPTAGTYNISVNYIDGCLAYLTNSTNSASCTAGTISGTAFTEAGTTTGTFAIGQELTGSGLPASTASAVVGLGTGIFIVSGSSPNWVINTPYTLTARAINGRTRVANEVNVFAVKGCDVSAMPGSAFDSGGPQLMASQYAAAPFISITTAAANCLVFSFGYSKNIPGTTTAEAGYTIMGATGTPAFWSQISTAPMAAGLKNPGSTINPTMLLADALKQGAAMTIALDGTPVFATSGPAFCAQPVAITTAQMDNSGTYWCVDGPQTKIVGGVWRYKSSVWERVSGSPAAVLAGLAFGTPGANSFGNATCVDLRAGKEGFVSFTGPNAGFRGFQTENGNATLASMTWTGSTGGSYTTNVTTDLMPWLSIGAITTFGAVVGDMVIDPVTGKYWQAGGNGVYEIDADLHYAGTGFTCNAHNQSQGIEEILVQGVLAIPGATNPLVGCEDEFILYTDLPNYPTTMVGVPAHIDSHVWDMDYASDNPAFVWAYVTGSVHAKASCYSNNYGVLGSWNFPGPTSPFTVAVGGVVTQVAHGMSINTPFTVSNSGGALPPEMEVGESYYVRTMPTSDTFTFATTSTSTGSISTSTTGTGTHSLTKPNYPPGTANAGGCVAVSSTGADGLSPINQTANLVVLQSTGTTRPVYTVDNGSGVSGGWQTCTDLPSQVYLTTKELATKLVAADRVLADTFYVYAPGNGVWRSTNKGANWTRVSTAVANIGGIAGGAGYSFLSVPGHAGHLWLVTTIYATIVQNLNYSTDGGVTWATVPGVTSADAVLNGTARPLFMTLGKPAPGNAYPTILTLAKIGGVDGFYRGVCNGAGPASGFTWTKFGDKSTVPPSNVIGNPVQLFGDPNVFGRLYVAWASNGVFMYNP